MEYREIADMGFEDGWNAAMSEVSKIVYELNASHEELDLANTIHEMVWRRLRVRQDAAMAERKAKRALRDEHAARLAKQS